MSPFERAVVEVFPILLLNFLTALPRVILFLTCLDMAQSDDDEHSAPGTLSSREQLQEFINYSSVKTLMRASSLLLN